MWKITNEQKIVCETISWIVAFTVVLTAIVINTVPEANQALNNMIAKAADKKQQRLDRKIFKKVMKDLKKMKAW